MHAAGSDFLFTNIWNPGRGQFGVMASVVGTLITSLLALIIGFPISLGIAIFLTELCPRSLRRILSMAIELLSGIPSIIYGICGLLFLAPFMQNTVQPFLIANFADVPIMNMLFQGPPYGLGILTASLVLVVMILPFMTAIISDIFATVPILLKEAAYGIGCTTAEMVRYVVLPYARTGIIGAVILGLGRALGETMAVTFVIGGAHHISLSLLSPGTTIAATIANSFTEANSEIYTSALITLGLILFLITVIVLVCTQLILRRLHNKEGI